MDIRLILYGILGIFTSSCLNQSIHSSLLAMSSKTCHWSEILAMCIKELREHIRACVSLMPTLLRIRDPDHKALSTSLGTDEQVERRLLGGTEQHMQKHRGR